MKNLLFLSEWRNFPSAPCLAGKRNWMRARVSMLLKSRASLTCFRACFLAGRAKDLLAPRCTIECRAVLFSVDFNQCPVLLNIRMSQLFAPRCFGQQYVPFSTEDDNRMALNSRDVIKASVIFSVQQNCSKVE